MSKSTDSRRCGKCGAALSDFATEGLCGACMLECALQPELLAFAEQKGAVSPVEGEVPAPPQPIVKPSRSEVETLGSLIGRYHLLEKIGEGGFGVVYVAEQREPVKRRVALKIIKLGMDTRQIVARFEAERQALAMMDHPNIAKVFDGGATDAGRPYFVMELVRGMKITDYCDQNNLSTRERLDLFIQVCQAIQHAHQKGIIHRDIKPSNVLVTVNDGVAVPKVIDFGIAKATQGELTEKTVYTQFQQLIGTPAYMSPEQAEMTSLDIDTRSDIYALGVLLYELLTGKTPFDHKELVKAGLEGMRRMIREQEPLRPSTRFSSLQLEERTTAANRRGMDAPKLVQQLRGDLDWIVMKCLEKDRVRRYETASGLAKDIQHHLDYEPVAASPPGALYRLQKVVRRHRVAFVATSAVAVALVLGVIVSTWQAVRAIRAERQAKGAQSSEASQRQRAETAELEIKNSLAASDFLQATRLIEEDKVADALAYLHRSLSLNSSNAAGWTRLATLLSERTWMLPMATVRHSHNVVSAHFSSDGKRILTASRDNTARLWDAQTGQPITEPLMHSSYLSEAQFSPDGNRIVTASCDNTARVWDARTGQPLTEPLKHSHIVLSAQFSPDGRRIVTASHDKTAKIWDAGSGQLLTEPLRHSESIDCAQFSPDGTRIVTASYDNTARVWNAQTGQPLTKPLKHSGSGIVVSAQFSPDGKRIVTASSDGTARIWDSQTGHPLTEFLQHSDAVTSAQFSPDGRRIVTASYDAAPRVWDAESGRPLIDTVKHTAAVGFARFSADGKRIVAAARDNTAGIWDSQTGESLAMISQPSGAVSSAEFSPDGKRILTGSWDNTARVWHPRSGPSLTQPLRHSGRIWSASFSPTGRQIVTASDDNTARIWDAQTGKPLTKTLQHSQGVCCAQFSPNTTLVVTGSADGTSCVWDSQTGQLLYQLLGHSNMVCSVQFSPDGKRIATASHDNTARVWDAQTGKPLTKTLQHSQPVRSAQFSPDGKRIATASFDGTARVWDSQTGQPLTGFLRHSSSMNSAQFSPDGKRIVTSSYDATARVWDVETGQPLSEPLKHTREVFSAQFSPDGKRIVTASADWTARVWDAQTGAMLSRPLNHSGRVAWAEFSPNGKLIVTASMDCTARVWDSETGQPLTASLRHTHHVNSVHFSPDGRQIVTASSDNTTRVWDIAPTSATYPDWLLELAQAFSGQILNKQGIMESVAWNPAPALDQIRSRLRQQPGDDDWVTWGRWLLADIDTRTISPFSKIAVPEYNETQTREKESVAAEGNLLELRAHVESSASRARWEEAIAKATKVVEAQPEDHVPYHMLAPLLVVSENLQGYRKLCEKILNQFRGATNAFIADRMAKDCLLLSSSGADLDAVEKLAETAVTAGAGEKALAYFQCTKALADYRQARFVSAADWAQRSIDNPSFPDPNRFVEAYMVLAMAHFQLHEKDEANAALAKGLELANKMAKLESGDIGSDWRDWIIAHALLKEARSLIEGVPGLPGLKGYETK